MFIKMFFLLFFILTITFVNIGELHSLPLDQRLRRWNFEVVTESTPSSTSATTPQHISDSPRIGVNRGSDQSRHGNKRSESAMRLKLELPDLEEYDYSDHDLALHRALSVASATFSPDYLGVEQMLMDNRFHRNLAAEPPPPDDQFSS